MDSSRDPFEIVECTTRMWNANILRLGPRSLRRSEKLAFGASASETDAAVTSEAGRDDCKRGN